MRFPEKMLLKLPAGTLGRIDGVTSNRNDWVRSLIDRALGVSRLPAEKAEKAEAQQSEVNGEGRWDADDATLLKLLARGPVMPRRVAERLGWEQLRVEKAADRLEAAKKITIAGGLLEVRDE